jgi:N-ethylmaleimide reductase
MYTFNGMQTMSVPKAMTSAEITEAQKEFVEGAKNAVAAGFDGVELHGANGYLFEQFLSPHVNTRTDDYGGTVANRARFLLEVASAVSAAIGADRVGVRLSPFSAANDMPSYEEAGDTHLYLAEKLNETGIAYLHIVENGADLIPIAFKKAIGRKFSQTIILAGNYDKQRAEQDIKSGLANVIAFGRPFLNNPDFVTRLRNNWPLSDNLDVTTLFTPDEKGYTDYQPYQSSLIAV